MRDQEDNLPAALLTALEDLSAEISYVADMLALIASSKGEFGATSVGYDTEALN